MVVAVRPFVVLHSSLPSQLTCCSISSPVGAVREGDIRADVSHVNDCAVGYVLSSINNELEGDLYFFSDVLAADLVLTEAESTALAR